MSNEMEINKTIKFWYMPVRGEGDKIRLLFAEAGVPYQELSVAGADLKEVMKESPCGKVPMLEHGKLRICGADTIMRYIGSLAGLNGGTKEDEALVDMWCEYINEVQSSLWAWQSDKQKCGQIITMNLGLISRALARSDNAFLVGNKISRADIALFSLLDSINRELPTVLASLPLLNAVHDLIKTRPQIVKFCASGKRYD